MHTDIIHVEHFGAAYFKNKYKCIPLYLVLLAEEVNVLIIVLKLDTDEIEESTTQ